MHDSNTENQIAESVQQAVGYKETRESLESMPILGWMAKSNSLAPAWWSPGRDIWLSAHWKKSNHLSSVVYNAQSKLSNIPPMIAPHDMSIGAHMDQSEEMLKRLMLVSEFGAGWGAAMDKFYEDYLTQDNGGFLEIIGNGNPAGPIIGLPIAIRHLSSRQCTRTGDPEYPIVYTTTRGKKYALNASRVIALSQMPSPVDGMNGVGFCAISRSFEIAQTLMDIVRYKQERLGSRPHSKLLVGKGIRAVDIMSAFNQAAYQQDDAGLAIAGMMVAIGSDSTDIDIDVKDLTHMDPFDEETSVTLGMYAIASAFGLDISEVWPTAGKSSTTDARIAQARARGKLPSQVTSALAGQLNLKFLPPHLHIAFDFRDDEEDQQHAIVRDIRGRHRTRETESGVMTFRAARKQMLSDGDIDRHMFEEMELNDGRLEDGTPITRLFFSNDPVFSKLLVFPGFDNPIDTAVNDPLVMMSAIMLAKANVATSMNLTSGNSKLRKMIQAYGALEWLEKQYRAAAFLQAEIDPDPEPEPDESEDTQAEEDEA